MVRRTLDFLPAVASAGLLILAWAPLQSRLVNVVTYEMVELAAPGRLGAVLPVVIPVSLLGLGEFVPRLAPLGPWARIGPLAALALLCGWSGIAPPGFVYACTLAIVAGWAVATYSAGLARPEWWNRAERFAPWGLGLAIAGATTWHAATQYHFWQHFSLGYADFGFFATELEYCLPWKDVPERFADTRMGYHCIPMFYLLAPFYALWRSPVLLMVAGPLALNVAAVPFYQLARHFGASPMAALLVGLSWLALPSLSRLPYANTYGFQSIYLAVPLLAFAWSLALRGRWRASHVCLALAMLCEETVCGVALGWGLYLLCFSERRRNGAAIAAASLGYLALCTLVVIPAFAETAGYSRLRLFGDVTAGGVFERLLRPRAALYVIAIVGPLAPALARGAAALKPLIIAAPTLALILLLQNDDYLNLKYWHQSSVLPALFAGAILGGTKGPRGGRAQGGSVHAEPKAELGRGIEGLAECGVRNAECGIRRMGLSTLGLFVTVLLFHQLLGFSPLAQSYRVFAADPAMLSPDPRREALAWVRTHYPRESTTVLATQRMAAHFCDYRAVRPTSGAVSEGAGPAEDVVVVDRADMWDPVVRERGGDALIEGALRHGYAKAREFGSVTVLARAGTRPARPWVAGRCSLVTVGDPAVVVGQGGGGGTDNQKGTGSGEWRR